MVRFRGKANVRPVLAAGKIEADFKAKLISNPLKKSITPARTSKALPASIGRRSTKTLTHATKTSPPSASRRPARTPSQIVKSPPSSAGRRSTRTPSKKTPSHNPPKSDVSDASLLGQQITARPGLKKPNLNTQELDDYTIGGFDSELIDASHWDNVSILNDSLPSLEASGESAFFGKVNVVKVKKETEQAFPADDPFGFFQVEREVKAISGSKQPEATPAKLTPRVNASAPKDETPGKRRSSRQVFKPSSYAQNKDSKRLSTINEKKGYSTKERAGLRGAVSKQSDDSRNKINKKPPKRSVADNEKLLKEERARIIAQFKAIDKFRLEEETV